MALRVVLVDDVTHVRRLVRTALRLRGGFDVVGEAADGAEAVAVTGRTQPDVVVLDLGLPDLTGRDLLAEVRHACPQAKVVVFSADDAPDIAGNVEGFVRKDAELDYLLDLLESLGRRRPPTAAVLSLSAEPGDVSRARRFVGGALGAWGLELLADDVQLLVSELVTNAITHTTSAPELRLSAGEGTVRVEVHDNGTGTPNPQPLSETAEHGRGMLMVAALSTAWGIEVSRGEGKVVWAELRHGD